MVPVITYTVDTGTNTSASMYALACLKVAAIIRAIQVSFLVGFDPRSISCIIHSNGAIVHRIPVIIAKNIQRPRIVTFLNTTHHVVAHKTEGC